MSGLWWSTSNRPGEGEVVCAQCGLVVAEAVVDMGPEWRSFDKEKRVRAAPLRLVVKTDMAVRLEHGARWRRLARFHSETLHGRGRRLSVVGAELRRVRECVGLSQSVVEEAEALVKKFFEVVGASRRRWWLWLSCGPPPRRLARLGRWRTF